MIEICKWMLVMALVCSVAACSDDKSEITSGGGSVIASDGGASSSKFAGTYKGMITTLLRGSAIDDRTSTDEIVIVIRTNGTASLTIDGETVEGNVNDNRLGFSIRIIEEDGLVKCDGNATVTGTISGNVASGNVIGSGGCDALAASTGLDITGDYTASKTN